MPPLYLSEAGSSVLHLLPVLGAALILPGLVNPRSGVQRTALFLIAMALSLPPDGFTWKKYLTFHLVADAESPWKSGRTERHGQWIQDLLE